MLSRISAQLANPTSTGAWLFVGAPRERVVDEVMAMLAAAVGLSPEQIGTHPDVFILSAPEEKTATGRTRMVSVDLVRDAVDRLTLTSFSGRKYLFVPDADLLSDSAQNALLKAIEDPSGLLVACFVAEHREHVLPTLRSRLTDIPLSSVERPVWTGSTAFDPEHFCATSTQERLCIVHGLIKDTKEDISELFAWLVCVQYSAVMRGDEKLFLGAVQAWDAVRAQGSSTLHLTALALI